MKTNKAVEQWKKETKRCYNALKAMPIGTLRIIANQGGLDLNHYTTKTLLAKGLLIKLTSGMMPIEMKDWK